MELGLVRVETDIADLFDSLQVNQASKNQSNSIKLDSDSFFWKNFQFTATALKDLLLLLQFDVNSFNLLSIRTQRSVLNDLLKVYLDDSSLLMIAQESSLVAVRSFSFNPVPATVFIDAIRTFADEQELDVAVDFKTYHCNLDQISVGVYFLSDDRKLHPGFYLDLNPFSDETAQFGPFVFSTAHNVGLRFPSNWFTYSMLRDDRDRLSVAKKLVKISVAWANGFLDRVDRIDINPEKSSISLDKCIRKPRMRKLFSGLFGQGAAVLNAFLLMSMSYRVNSLLKDSYEFSTVFLSILEEFSCE